MAHPEGLLDNPNGSSLTWILDHCVRYPGTYEIPLRTMYELNCNSLRQSPPGTRTPETAATAPRPSNSFKASHSSGSSIDSTADFKAQLTQQISRLPSQPCSLPPSFITNFLRRCFAPELEDVDFPQALCALDYLKDLDIRRKKDVSAALQRLQIRPEDLTDRSDLAQRYPGVMGWIESMSSKGRKADALYTQIYIGLRRWTLINEMLLEPFSKGGCIAMLNTLFPPVTETTAPPAAHLTHHILRSHRDGFFRYIRGVEINGKDILQQLRAQGAPEGSEDGWAPVRDALDRYLRIANEIIDECASVTDHSSLGEEPSSSIRSKSRKVDSGVSFCSTERLPAPSADESDEMMDKPLPPSPTKKGGSTLERLAREIRKLGLGDGKTKSLKKMKSTSALSTRGEPGPADYASFFDIDEQKRKRLIWEAKNRRYTHHKRPSTQSKESSSTDLFKVT